MWFAARQGRPLITMTYRFKPGRETVSDGIRRIAAEQFAHIFRALGDEDLPPARRVHEGRKAVKRLRSLIRLIGPVFPDVKVENAALRDAARKLSVARDSGAVMETLGLLKLPEEVQANTHDALSPVTAARVSPEEAERLLKAFGRTMQAAAKRAAKWEIEAEGIDALAPGIRRGYRRLRKSFRDAAASGEEERLHDWRKCAKDHWHHTLLLRAICFEAMQAHARMAEHLSDALGDWRDAGLVSEALDQLPAKALSKDDIKTVKRALVRAQKRALRKARRRAALLIAESPGALVSRWSAYWTAQ